MPASAILLRNNSHYAPPAPVLEAEEARPEFDIATYGRGIVARLEVLVTGRGGKQPEVASSGDAMAADEESHSVPPSEPFKFADVLPPNAPRYEVCRAFLASLQLANAGNIEIVAPAAPQLQQPAAATKLPRSLTAGRKAVKQHASAEGAGASTWAFTQEVVYAAEGDLPDAVIEAAAAHSRAAEKQRRVAGADHSGGEPICGSFSGAFSLRLLSTHLPPTFDADAAASASSAVEVPAPGAAGARATKPKKTAASRVPRHQQRAADVELGAEPTAEAAAAAPAARGALRRTNSASSNRGGDGGAVAPKAASQAEAVIASPAHKRSRPALPRADAAAVE